MQQDSRNLILTIVLSFLILMGWQYFYEQPRIEEQNRVAQIQAEARSKEVEREVVLENKKVELMNRDQALQKDARVKIDNGKISGSISLKGARIDDITLNNYYVTTEKKEKVVLLTPSDSFSSYFTEFGWLTNNAELMTPNADTVWTADKDTLKAGETVTLSWDNGQGQLFNVYVSLDENYLFNIKQTVKNNGASYFNLTPYGLINRAYEHDHETYAILHEGPLGVFNDKLEEVTFASLEKDNKVSYKDNNSGWLGMTDKYWFTALIPDSNSKFNANFNYTKDGELEKFQVDFLGDKLTLAPNDVISSSLKIFAGAKELDVIDNYESQYNIPLFDRAVDFGWFYFITKPIFLLLKMIYQVIGNFGVSILVLTVIIKLLLLPIASKSYKSMNAMKKVQPEIIRLKEMYGKDKMRFNTEMMELYKKEKINPLSGCLPLLIQIPVFFSLYKVLFVTIEMRHAPFFGWILDLSASDPTSVLNLFGLIPFATPDFLTIGAWPLIMGFTMYIQQSMNPAPQDPVQAQVMKFMPVMFTFMFAGFPAGLVIYWAWNNILSILQQWYLLPKEMRKFSKKAVAK